MARRGSCCRAGGPAERGRGAGRVGAYAPLGRGAGEGRLATEIIGGLFTDAVQIEHVLRFVG